MLDASPSAVARAIRPVAGLYSHPRCASVVLAAGDGLYAVSPATLESACRAGRTLSLPEESPANAEPDSSPRDLRLLATHVESGVRFDSDGETVRFVRRELLNEIDLVAGGPVRRVTLPELPGVPVDAASDGGSGFVCVTRDDSDVDLARYDVVSCTADPRSTATTLFTAALRPELAWCESAGSWLAFDPAAETLWRIAGVTRRAQPVEVSRARSRGIAGLLVHPSDRWIALRLTDANDGTTQLLHGWFNAGTLHWDLEADLGDGLIDHLRWRPTAREFALVRHERRKARIEVIDALGGLRHACDLPRGWCVSDLTWSPDGNQLFAVCGPFIAAWRVPAVGNGT